MEQTTYKKNAVFVSAGKTSLHRQLLKGDADFDLHLLIYDDSYSLFCDDTKFISVQSGYKMDMTYRYLQSHPEFLENYEYFFLMDDDIEMSTEDVNKLFRMMREYDLKIAQPSLVMSYYTYKHTAHHPLCVLRYTNFVEMMVPCFSKEALVKVLPTFEKKVRGCGIEMHWASLIHAACSDMAVVDAVHAIHVRRLQPWSEEDHTNMLEYLNKHHLTWRIQEYSANLLDTLNRDRTAQKSEFDSVREQFCNFKQRLCHGGLSQMKESDVVYVVSFFLLNSVLWNDRTSWDIGIRLTLKMQEKAGKNLFADLQELKRFNEFHTVELVERHIVKYLESNKIPRYVLYWFGGEPLLQKDIVGKLTTALGAYCRDNNIEFVGQITTNGALLDIPTIKMLGQAQVNSYQITLDGDRRLHDKTKFDGMHESSFNTIAGNVANLLRINTEAIVVLRYNYTQKNVGHLSVVDELCQYIPDELRQRVRIDLQRVWQVDGDSVSLPDLGRLQRKFVDNGFALLTLGMFEPCYVEKHRFEVIYYNGRVDVCDNYAFDKARGMITESGLVDWRQAVEIPDLHKACLDCPYLPVCLEECPAKRLRAKSSGKEFICTEEIKRHVEFTIKDYCLRIINNKRVK